MRSATSLKELGDSGAALWGGSVEGSWLGVNILAPVAFGSLQ